MSRRRWIVYLSLWGTFLALGLAALLLPRAMGGEAMFFPWTLIAFLLCAAIALIPLWNARPRS